MDTVNRFVTAVLGSKDNYTHCPDRSMFELDTLVTFGNPQTTFFEFYWAHQVKGTR